MPRAIRRLLVRCKLPLSYTPEQVTRLLKVRRERVDWLLSTFRLRSVLLRGRRYVTRAELERFLDRRR